MKFDNVVVTLCNPVIPPSPFIILPMIVPPYSVVLPQSTACCVWLALLPLLCPSVPPPFPPFIVYSLCTAIRLHIHPIQIIQIHPILSSYRSIFVFHFFPPSICLC